MAARPGTIQERVYYSWVDRLSKLEPSEFPASLQDQFDMLRLLVTSQSDQTGGALYATIMAMSEQEAVETAALMVLLARGCTPNAATADAELGRALR